MPSVPNNDEGSASIGELNQEFSIGREELEQYISIVEKEFSVEWLEKYSLKTKHPVPQIWKAMKDFLGGENEFSMQIYYGLKELSDDIQSCQNIPNYDSEIKPRLFHPNQYENAKYEMAVASYLKSRFEQVKFFRRSSSGRRTPDLQVFHDSSPFYIECTRTQSIPGIRQKKSFTSNESDFVDSINTILRDFEENWDIYVIFLRSSNEGTIQEDIKAQLRGLLTDRQSGRIIDVGLNYGVIAKNPPQQPDQVPREGEMTLRWPMEAQGITTGTVRQNEEGKWFFENIKRCGVYTLNALKIKSILNKIENKLNRYQTRGSSPGIVVMDLDLSNLSSKEETMYLELASDVLQKCFKTTRGQQIGLLGLTIRAILKPWGPGDEYLFRRRKVHWIANPHCHLPSHFPLP